VSPCLNETKTPSHGREPRLPFSTYLNETKTPSHDMFVVWDGVSFVGAARPHTCGREMISLHPPYRTQGDHPSDCFPMRQ